MALYLFETTISEQDRTREQLKEKVSLLRDRLTHKDAALIEVQIAKDLSTTFFIVETEHVAKVEKIFTDIDVVVDLKKEVRLIGENIDEVKNQKGKVNFVVEWNLPEHLTMEQYLERKEKNSVKYAEVPEVSFARTYVCEDMTKCLCFYDAPNKGAVEKARDVVSAPIDVLTELSGNE